MPDPAPSPRTEVRRKPQRARYDRATIEAIVDEALICHVAFSHGGSVHCLPMACWRSGEHLYIHGAANSRMASALLAGTNVTWGPSPPRSSMPVGASGTNVEAIWRVLRRLWSRTRGTNWTGGRPNRANTR